MKAESPLVFRIEKALMARLEKAADELRLKKYTLALLAIEAAVEAIEANNYRLVLPIEFQVAHLPERVTGGQIGDAVFRREAAKAVSSHPAAPASGREHTSGKPEAASIAALNEPPTQSPAPPSAQTEVSYRKGGHKNKRSSRKSSSESS
jgi:hypothetical protein